jgi:hypothetical protein
MPVGVLQPARGSQAIDVPVEPYVASGRRADMASFAELRHEPLLSC